MFDRTVTHEVLVTTDKLSSRCDMILGADFIHDHHLAYDPVTQQPHFVTPSQSVTAITVKPKEKKTHSVRFSIAGEILHPVKQLPLSLKRKGQNRAVKGSAHVERNKTREKKESEFPETKHGETGKQTATEQTEGASEPRPSVQNQKNPCSVFLKQDVLLPALSEKIVVAKVSHRFPVEDAKQAVLIEPHETGCFKEHLLVARSVNYIYGSNPRRVLVKILNTASTPVTLRRHTVIASVAALPAQSATDCATDSDTRAETVSATSSKEDPSPHDNDVTIESFDLSNVPAEHKERLKALLMKYLDVFGTKLSDIKGTDVYEHPIKMADDTPVYQKPYRMPFAHREELQKQVKELEESGIIEESVSPYNAPVILVQRDAKSKPRFCLDYRRLNAKCAKDSFPSNSIQEVLDRMSGQTYFSTLDLLRSFHQVKITDDTKAVTAFSVGSKKYHFNRVPFGYVHSSTALNRALQIALAGLDGSQCLAYIDDLIVFSKNIEDHFDNLEQILQRLQKHKFVLRPDKCHFLMTKVKYLGFEISSQGVTPDPAKISAVKNYPAPQTKKQVKQFLGFANFYRRYIPRMADLAAPLNYLTRDDVDFKWTEECDEAFNKIKKALINYPVLRLPRFDREFYLTTDASRTGISCILEQRSSSGILLPVAYYSRALNKAERNYSTTELECLAIVWGFQQNKVYLTGHKTIVFTDHLPLKSLLKNTTPGHRLTRWSLQLSQYDFEIHYLPGHLNTKADVLSRIPHSTQSATDFITGTNAITTTSQTEWTRSQIRAAQLTDNRIRPIIDVIKGKSPQNSLKVGRISLDEFFLSSDDILYHVTIDPAYKTRQRTEELVVPSSMRHYVLKTSHDSLSSGHLGITQTYDKIRRQFYWYGMYGDIKRYVMSCKSCFERNSHRYREKPPLQRFTAFTEPLDTVSLDIVGPFTTTYSGNRYILTIMDEFTKWPELFAIPDQTAETISKIFVKEIICRHGTPRTILTDQGRNFTSNLLRSICDQLNIRKIQTSAYHPQSNARVERANSMIAQILSHIVDSSTRDWDEMLPFVLLSLRSKIHSTLHESPYYLLYMRDMRLPHPTDLDDETLEFRSIDDYKTEMLRRMKQAHTAVEKYVEKAAIKQERLRAGTVRDSDLKEGDLVYLYVPATPVGVSRKLLRKNKGPYRIIEKTSPVNARIRHVLNERDEQMVHVERLRRYHDYMADELVPPAETHEPDSDEQHERNNELPEQQVESETSDSVADDENINPLFDYTTLFEQPVVPEPQRGGYNLRPRQGLRAPNRYS